MKKSRIFVVIMLITFIITTSVSGVGASNAKYEVYDVKAQKVIKSGISKFSDAEKLMMQSGKHAVVKSSDSESPEQIVAAHPKEAYAIGNAFSMQTGNAYKEKTLSIFSDENMSSTVTYVTNGYKLHYLETIEKNGSLMAKVSIQGAEGYVNIQDVDLIPFHYIEASQSFKTRYFLSSSQLVTRDSIFKHDYYFVKEDPHKKVKEISFHYQKYGDSMSIGAYAVAADWLPSNRPLYSADGIEFYTDPQLRNSVSVGKKFYAYYQWLPLRSSSNVTAQHINDFLIKKGKNKSVILNNESSFIENSNRYGTNALLLFAQAAIESAYGTSWYAINRYNLFGWNAFDSNPDLATTYLGVNESVKKQVAQSIVQYFNLATESDPSGLDWRNAGLAFGNKGSGISVRYASDPFYGMKISAIAYELDKTNDFFDYNAHDLIKLKDGQATNVRKEPKGNAPILYTTRPGLKNQIQTNKGVVNGFYKTNLHMGLKNGKAVQSYSTQHVPMDTTKDFGYVATSVATQVPSHGPKAKSPSSLVTVSENKETAVVTEDLNLRISWGTQYRRLLTIPKGTQLTVYRTTNGWAKTNYDGRTGFVSIDYLRFESDHNQDTKPPQEKPEVSTDYVLGDVNNDGYIDGFDMLAVKAHYLGVKNKTLSGSAFKAADVNKDNVVDGFDMMEIKVHYLKHGKTKVRD